MGSFRVLQSFHLPVLCQHHAGFVTVALKCSCRADAVVSTAFSLLRIAFVIWSLLCFHVLNGIVFISLKNVVEF